MKSFGNGDFSGTYEGTNYLNFEGNYVGSPITIVLTQNRTSITAEYTQEWEKGDEKCETKWICTGGIDSNGYFELEGTIGTTAKLTDEGNISFGEWKSDWVWESLEDGRKVYGYITATKTSTSSTSTTITTDTTTTSMTISTTTSCHPMDVCGDDCCNRFWGEHCCNYTLCCFEDNICCGDECCSRDQICKNNECLYKIPCSSAMLYGEYSEEAELLRDFRDEVLGQTQEGQEIIKLYYQWSPVIVKAMEDDEEFKEEVKEMIDGVLVLINSQIE